MPYRILIVDDDNDFRSEFREILEDEYEVLEASDGEAAIEMLKKPNITDLVLLDVKMRGLQGTDVLKKLKEMDPGLIIVIITGYGSKDVIVESLRGHADDFLEKPVNIEKTLKLIESLLEKKQKEVKGIIEKLKYFIEKNFHKNINLKEASDVVCLSPKYISRIFKDNTGMGFNVYKLKIKMSRAKELLCTTEYNINEISYKTGYLNVESFIRIFKKIEGITPTQYRHSARVRNTK